MYYMKIKSIHCKKYNKQDQKTRWGKDMQLIHNGLILFI